MTSITFTKTQSNTSHLTLSSKELTIESLVNEILQSNIFTFSEKNQIKQWASEVKQLKDPEDIAVSLCYFLFTFLYPALMSQGDRTEKLLAFEDGIKKLLKTYIPKEKEVDLFIEECNAQQCEINKLAAIEEAFKNVSKHLYTSANSSNQLIAETFLNLKSRILLFKEKHQTLNGELKDKVESMIKEIEQMNQETLRCLK